MKAVLESLSWNDEAQARIRFVVTWLALTGARRSEPGAGTTAQLSRVRSGDDGFVLWKRMGKQSAVSENLVDQLEVMSLLRYRLCMHPSWSHFNRRQHALFLLLIDICAGFVLAHAWVGASFQLRCLRFYFECVRR
jgi:hypothetical protein